VSLYVDASALLKRYVAESESDRAEEYLLADKYWVTARHTWVEVRRNLAKLLDGNDLASARTSFERDFRRTHIVELDEATCEMAAQIAEASLLRTLDALHLAALLRVGHGLPLLTFDIRQAQAARALAISVVGA
jgi:predicted nucleic acid-binding protein